jgi:hypothetical protein
VVRHAEVLILGLGGQQLLSAIAANTSSEQVVVDLVGVPRDALGPASCVGACW